MPTVSPRTIMLYAPRDEGELAVVLALLEQGYRAALGVRTEGADG